MAIVTRKIALNTKGNADMLDITRDVAEQVSTSGFRDGTACIFCPSSTSALTTIEYESGCLSDLRRLFNELVDPELHYAHNARWGDGNGHSHVRAALLGPSLVVPFVSGSLTLGVWQQIILVDFDNRARRRELIVQIQGE